MEPSRAPSVRLLSIYLCYDFFSNDVALIDEMPFVCFSYITVGAILPGMDAGDGAKAGAAVGAFSGGVGGLRGRRRRFG